MVRPQQSNKVGKSPRITALEQRDGLAENRTAMAVLNDSEDRPHLTSIEPSGPGQNTNFL